MKIWGPKAHLFLFEIGTAVGNSIPLLLYLFFEIGFEGSHGKKDRKRPAARSLCKTQFIFSIALIKCKGEGRFFPSYSQLTTLCFVRELLLSLPLCTADEQEKRIPVPKGPAPMGELELEKISQTVCTREASVVKKIQFPSQIQEKNISIAHGWIHLSSAKT